MNIKFPRSGSSNAHKTANKKWDSKQAQIAIKVNPDFKAKLAEHCKIHNESLTAFIVRACNTQMTLDLDKLLEDD